MHKEEKTPFMVTVLLAVGAWFVCLASVFFFALYGLVWFGAAFVVLAAFLTYGAARSGGASRAFLMQAALAFSLFGKGMLLFGLADLWRLKPGGAFALTAVTAVLSYPLFTQKADRALTVFAAAWCGFYCAAVQWGWEALWLETAAVGVFAAAYILFLSVRRVWQPLAWGLLASCAFAFCFPFFTEGPENMFGGMNNVLLGVFLCGTYVWRRGKNADVLSAALIVLLSYAVNIGVCMGAALLVLGYARKCFALKTAGTVVFALSLFWLYYQMQTTLLVKSYYLCAAGLVLLGTYVLLKRGEPYDAR